MPFYERGKARIRYQEAGSGFPLFIIYGGGLDSKVTYANGPFDAVAEFKGEYRCITMDLRNAEGGESTGPLGPEQPWDMHTADQLGLLDHLGVDYVGVDVLQDDELREGIKTYSDWPTIPQLYIKNEFIGGADIVREMFQSGELKTALSEKGLLPA